MAGKVELLQTVVQSTAPMSPRAIAKVLGRPAPSFQTQLRRMVKSGELTQNTHGEYSITDAGREYLDLEPSSPPGGAPGEAEAPTTQEGAKTTEYQQFMTIGRMIGIEEPLVKLTADHIWGGGDYKNMTWVWNGLSQQGIRPDLRSRWWHSWRTTLRQPVPMELRDEVAEAESVAMHKQGESEGMKRTHIIGADGTPIYVGRGLGDIDYKDAVDIIRMKAIRGSPAPAAAAQPGQPASTGDLAGELVKVINALRDWGGDNKPQKSFVLTPGEEGYHVSEIEPGKPIVMNLPSDKGTGAPVTYYVDQDGTVKEAKPGEPIVIRHENKTLNPPTVSPHYMIDKSTGEVTEVKPGQPIVIVQRPVQPTMGTPIQLQTPDGQPIVMDINTMFALQDHQATERRQQEAHEAKMDIVTSFKKLLTSMGKAASKMERG